MFGLRVEHHVYFHFPERKAVGYIYSGPPVVSERDSRLSIAVSITDKQQAFIPVAAFDQDGEPILGTPDGVTLEVNSNNENVIVGSQDTGGRGLGVLLKSVGNDQVNTGQSTVLVTVHGPDGDTALEDIIAAVGNSPASGFGFNQGGVVVEDRVDDPTPGPVESPQV